MLKHVQQNRQKVNFDLLMKITLIGILILISVKSFSQENVIAGIIFDNDSKERVALVNVKDITTGEAVYDNIKGEFRINAHAGDVLVFLKTEYHNDTIKVKSEAPLAVYLPRISIQLKEVTIRDSMINPDRRLAVTKRDFSKIYGSLGYRDFLTMPSSGGVGISIDAIWNSLSRSGRNAAHLQEIIQQDYQQNVIDYRFNKNLVARITGLKDEKLVSFMTRYRPGYYTASSASEYEFVSMIKSNYKRFLHNPRTYSVPPLKNI